MNTHHAQQCCFIKPNYPSFGITTMGIFALYDNNSLIIVFAAIFCPSVISERDYSSRGLFLCTLSLYYTRSLDIRIKALVPSLELFFPHSKRFLYFISSFFQPICALCQEGKRCGENFMTTKAKVNITHSIKTI